MEEKISPLHNQQTFLTETYVHFKVNQVRSLLQVLYLGFCRFSVNRADDLHDALRVFIQTYQLGNGERKHPHISQQATNIQLKIDFLLSTL